MLKTNRYRVTIHADGKLYRTTGALAIAPITSLQPPFVELRSTPQAEACATPESAVVQDGRCVL